MKVSASVLLFSAALGVSARPSGHAHFHDKRDYVVANKPVVVTTVVEEYNVAAATSSSVAAAAATSSAAAASSSAASSSSSSVPQFCTGSSSKRATTGQIAYKGNTGTTYGCNIMNVDSSITDKYDYSATFVNSVDKDQACVCWNKIGPDGGINGFFKGNQAISFTLPAKGTKAIAVQKNSQGGCACSVGSSIATSKSGQFLSTWLEFDFGNESNNGWSGADASALAAFDLSKADGVTYDKPALDVCSDSSKTTCSTIYSGGTGKNAYTEGTNDVDGTGLNLNTKTVHLYVTVGN